jgi:hypothetical protein
MTKSRSKQLNEKHFTKRRGVDDGIKLADAAHAATWRLYCDVLQLWRACPNKRCRRHRRCHGEPAACLMRGLPTVPPEQRLAAAAEVLKGGPRRLAPATHMEYGWCAASRCRCSPPGLPRRANYRTSRWTDDSDADMSVRA